MTPVAPIELNMPLVVDPDTVAVVFDAETGDEWDQCYSLESALNYAATPQMYVVVAVGQELWNSGEVRYSEAEVAEAIAHQYELVADCFGWSIPTVSAA